MMTTWREWVVTPIVKDFKQKELLPVKILFFVHMSTILVLYPYLTIHMRELGINVEETAVMSSLTPVVGILMPPLAGLIADKIGNFKIMLTLFSMLSGLSALLLLLIPIGRINITYPSRVDLGISCNTQNPLSFSLYEDYPCDLNNYPIQSHVTVESCGFVCHAFLSEDDSNAVLRTTNYEIQMHNLKENKTQLVRLNLPSQQPKHMYYTLDDFNKFPNHMTLKNNLNYSTSIRKFSKSSYFFPTPELFNFSCALRHHNGDQYNNTNVENKIDLPLDMYQCQFTNHKVLKSFKLALNRANVTEDDLLEGRKLFNVNMLDGQSDVDCSEGYGQNKNYLTVRIDLKAENETTAYKSLDLGACASRCLASAPRADFCKNPKKTIEKDVNLTFWTYLGIRVFIGIIGGTAYTMFEGAVIAILREYKADYGLQRMYAQLGGMISSPLSGLLIDYASSGKSYTDFRPIFYLYCGLKVTSAVLMLFINLEFKSPAKSVVADVKSVIKVELVSLFVAAFLLGSAWGYIESFLFWLLEDLGGTKSLMGLTITVGGILGIPLLALSGPLVQKFGHANIIFIGFLAYAIRLYGYSIIYNPWYSLIFEAMECLTHSLCFTALVTYAAKLSSVTTDTTIQGIIGGLFYGVGKSAGSLVGGYLIKYIGMRGTFQIFAGVTCLTAFFYLAFYHFYMKSRTAVSAEAEETKQNDTNEKDCEKGANNAKSNPGFEDTEIKNTINLGKIEPEVKEHKQPC